MLTKAEKRIVALIVALLGVGFLSQLFTQNAVEEFPGSSETKASLPTPALDSAPTQVNSPETLKIAPKSKSPGSEMVLVNSADSKNLQNLPGIGPVLAQSILDHRKKYGPFKKKSDMLKVKGIGPKKLEKISPFISLEEGN